MLSRHMPFSFPFPAVRPRIARYATWGPRERRKEKGPKENIGWAPAFARNRGPGQSMGVAVNDRPPLYQILRWRRFIQGCLPILVSRNHFIGRITVGAQIVGRAFLGILSI